jgi:hypothetical protein
MKEPKRYDPPDTLSGESFMQEIQNGDYVRYDEYAHILELLKYSKEEVKQLENEIKVIKMACREEMEDLKKYYENERN